MPMMIRPRTGLFGPLGSSTSSLLAVERALAEMECGGGKTFSKTSYTMTMILCTIYHTVL
jgi:hypothetical protein